jgi:hypothetical protein
MSELKTQIAVLETKMEQITEQVKEGFSNNSKEHKEIIELFEIAMEKKAGKWTEKAIIGVVIFVLTAVGTAFMALVIKQ